MPPRLQFLRPLSLQTPLSTSRTSFLHFLPQSAPHRHASILASLSDTPGSYSKRIRRGRGPSSGKGKTSGRGHKGQKQHGKVPHRTLLGRFNGGQTPDIIVHGKRGFENQFSVEMSTINLDRIQTWIDQGRLDATKPITVKELKRSQCLSRLKDGVKLLAKNATTLTHPIHITVSRASASAISAIEAAGGTVQTRYYTAASLSRVLADETHPTLSLLSQPPADAMPSVVLQELQRYRYRLPDPTARKDLEYYRDEKHRGYLSYQVREGQGPSLFFKTPREVAVGVAGGPGVKRRVKSAAVQGARGENSLW